MGTIQPTGSEIQLKSTADNSEVKKIDVYPTGEQATISDKDTGETSCQQLFLQGRSDLSVKSIDLKDIYIGLLSSLHLEDAKYENAIFHVKYNRQTPETIFPISFKVNSNGFPQFKGEIHIEKLDPGAIISDDQEELLIAEFNPTNGNDLSKAWQACNEYNDGQYKGGEGFNNAKCTNTTDKVVFKSLKSTDKDKNDGSKGLSAGAIAGIVIACVVVVAAIIALLVYFLVIKKRNASTTSTQGDSSIAI